MIKAGIAVFPWKVMHRTGALFNIEILKKAVFVHLMKTGKREPTSSGERKLADGTVLRLRGPRRDGSSRAGGLGGGWGLAGDRRNPRGIPRA